ncbi:MAG: PEGA domain-containing protein, partial [bacterium]
MIVAQPLLCRAQLAAISRSVAVQPLLDGDADDDSREAASAIGAALRVSTPHHIIDSEMSAKVVGYQDKKGDASAGARAAANSLEAAKEHYFAFRYKDARAELDRAISILRPMPPGPESGMLLVDAYITQAMTAKSMRDDAGAREACAAALLIHPALEISGSEYPPSLVSIFDGARKNLRAAPTGSLALRSKPPAAEVFINGILRGVTPLEIADLPAGNYSLLIRANKYKQDERIVTIESGKRLAVDEKLKWAKGKEGGV